MKSQQEFKEAMIQAQLAKITKQNPNAIPLYIIINSINKGESVEQPITLCTRDTLVSDFVAKMRKKYPKYQEVYFFGKDRKEKGDMTQGKKRKSFTEETPDRIVAIDEQMQAKTMDQIYQGYKDGAGLLIVLVSELALLKPKKRPISELLLFFLAGLFLLAFLYVTFSEEPGPRGESELDYIV